MAIKDNVINMQAQNTVYDFIAGKMSFESFNRQINSIVEDIGTLFNNAMSDCSQTEILEIAEKYARPLSLRFDFCKSQIKKLEEQQIELFDKYNVPIEQLLIINPYRELHDKRKEEFLEGIIDFVRFIRLKIEEIYETNQTYNGRVGFFSEKLIYELFLTLYDSIIGYDGKLVNEYEIRYNLIIDSFLDKIVGGNSYEMENFINKNIFMPTCYITDNSDVSLLDYNKRLAKVKKLINQFFPCDINRAKYGWDMHGKWPLNNGEPMTLCAKHSKNGKDHYLFRGGDKEILVSAD